APRTGPLTLAHYRARSLQRGCLHDVQATEAIRSAHMSTIPRDTRTDSTLALLSEGYTLIPRRCQRLKSDIFETRLMFKPVICTQGEEAARQFYTPDRFTRAGAMPTTTLMLLQDKG